jgi:prophage regulatory protein
VQVANEARQPVPRDRLLRLPDVEATTGLKKSSIYVLMKRGEFPRCVQLTARCVAWPESHVMRYVQDRIAQTGHPNSHTRISNTTPTQGAQQ